MNIKPIINVVKPVAKEVGKVVAVAVAEKVGEMIKDRVQNGKKNKKDIDCKVVVDIKESTQDKDTDSEN